MNLYVWMGRIVALGLALMLLLSSWGAVAAAVMGQGAPPFDLPVGSNYVMAVAVVGFLMSPIISFLNRVGWSPEGKAVGAFVWCFVAAAILFFAGDRFDTVVRDPKVLFGTFLGIFLMATGLYTWYFKPSGIGPSIEEASG